METDPVSETSCFYPLKHWMMEKVQKPSNSNDRQLNAIIGIAL
jgi:hypothetical protein